MLLRIPAFAKTRRPILSALIKASPVVTFVDGDVLVRQGERSNFAFILLSGDVAVVNERQHGQAPLARVAAPALVGEIGALAGLRRTASVVAAGPVRALHVSGPNLLDACRDSPDILVAVIAQLGRHIESVNYALGLYAAGFAALERGALDSAILDDLNNPTAEVRAFTDAFKRLANRIALERRNHDEMASAALIQRAMLPQGVDQLPLAGRCRVFGDMRPARDVGGDFYDISMLDDDRVALTIGDVCGKGVPASLFMSQTMTTLRMAAVHGESVSATLEATNAMLCAQNPSLMFSTAIYGVLDLTDGRFEYASCGHSPPLLLRAGRGCLVLPAGGSPLGLVPGRRFVSETVTLHPGDAVFLFTDGVTECTDPGGVEYGDARLRTVLDAAVAGGAHALVESVMADVAHFTGGAEPFDDVTCVSAVLA